MMNDVVDKKKDNHHDSRATLVGEEPYCLSVLWDQFCFYSECHVAWNTIGRMGGLESREREREPER